MLRSTNVTMTNVQDPRVISRVGPRKTTLFPAQVPTVQEDLGLFVMYLLSTVLVTTSLWPPC